MKSSNEIFKKTSASSQENPSIPLSLNVNPSADFTTFSNCFKEMKINKTLIHNYETYVKQLESLFSQQLTNVIELDYRYDEYCKKNSIPKDSNLAVIEKMKLIGKIGIWPTTLIENNSNEDGGQLMPNLRYETDEVFGSIRANNCLTSGKWFYEVQLLTNDLIQIGWCQFVTPFRSNDGVGDDQTSYAYDGWRRVKWHNGREEYGQLWDIGDIIGVCIDIDNRTIDFYVNGISQGEAFNCISTGTNIAYFPGCSMNRGGKVVFNFGQSPFQYIYPGYEPIDIPCSVVNGSFDITISIIELLKQYLLSIISDDKIRQYEKVLVCQMPFEYLANISCFDTYILKSVLLSFLIELSINKTQFASFFEMLFIQLGVSNKKEAFAFFLMDTITSMIEEYSLMGTVGLTEWKRLMSLLMSFLSIDCIIQNWQEVSRTAFLKRVFSSNYFHINTFYLILTEKYNIKEFKHSALLILTKAEKHYEKKYGLFKLTALEAVYSEYIIKLMSFILFDKETVGANQLLKSIFSPLLFQFLQEVKSKEEMSITKNIYFNFLKILADTYFDTPFESITTEPWIKGSSNDSIYFYFEEDDLGGTIAHVTEEYLKDIPNTFIVKSTNSNDLHSFFHKVLITSKKFSILLLKSLESIKSTYGKMTLEPIFTFNEDGSSSMSQLFRTHFYLFSLNSQALFYQFSFFLVKYFIWLRDTNPKLLYFIPNCVIELPFSFYKLLVNLSSKVLQDHSLRSKINHSSKHFINDDLVQSIVNFYFYLFSDKAITNPNIKEDLLNKIDVFNMQKDIMTYYEKDLLFEEYIVNGLFNNINNGYWFLMSSKTLLRIIAPFGFPQERERKETVSESMIKRLRESFITYYKSSSGLLASYYKIVNEMMTDYSIRLAEAKEVSLDSPDEKNALKLSLRNSYSTYVLVCDLLSIYEFFLSVIPEALMTIDSLEFVHFLNVLKNLSNRIIVSPYLETLVGLTQIIPLLLNTLREFKLASLLFPIIGIMLNIHKQKGKPYYDSFIVTIANMVDFNLLPFEQLHSQVTALVTAEDNCIEELERYSQFIKEIQSKKTLKEEDTTDTKMPEDQMCILCYANWANAELLPCKHRACIECIKQHRSEKSLCFICHTEIKDMALIEK